MPKPRTENHRQAAVQFLKLVVSGHIDEAYQKYVDMKGKHTTDTDFLQFPQIKVLNPLR